MKEKIQLATVSDFDRQAITLSAASVNIGLIFFLYQLQCHVFWKDVNMRLSNCIQTKMQHLCLNKIMYNYR